MMLYSIHTIPFLHTIHTSVMSRRRMGSGAAARVHDEALHGAESDERID